MPAGSRSMPPPARFQQAATGSIELVGARRAPPRTSRPPTRRGGGGPQGPSGGTRRAGSASPASAAGRDSPSTPGVQRGAIWRDDDGAVQGAVAYKVDDQWTRNRPTARADVQLLVGATPEAERELWRHLCEIDWVQTVQRGQPGHRRPAAPLPRRTGGPRSCSTSSTASGPGSSTCPPRSAVVGPSRPPASSPRSPTPRLRRRSVAHRPRPRRGRGHATTDAPDVVLSASALGAMYLGGRSARRLHEAGWLEEGSPGGVARLDAALRTATAPWSPTTY